MKVKIETTNKKAKILKRLKHEAYIEDHLRKDWAKQMGLSSASQSYHNRVTVYAALNKAIVETVENLDLSDQACDVLLSFPSYTDDHLIQQFRATYFSIHFTPADKAEFSAADIEDAIFKTIDLLEKKRVSSETCSKDVEEKSASMSTAELEERKTGVIGELKAENNRLKKELLKYTNLPNHYSLDDLYVMAKFFGGKDPQDVIGRFQLLERANKEHQDRIEELKHEVTVLYNRCKAPMKNAVVSRLEAEAVADERLRKNAARECLMSHDEFNAKTGPIFALNNAIVSSIQRADLEREQCENLLGYPKDRNLLNSIRWAFYAIQRPICWDLMYRETGKLDLVAVLMAIYEVANKKYKEEEK